jgi:hypothetical protein
MIVPLFPILLLVTAVLSILWYQRTANDIYGVLAVGSAVICVIWGLVIAHWLVHLLSLAILLRLISPQLSAMKPNNS